MREIQRHVLPGAEEMRFALKWAESMLRDWIQAHGEAAIFVGEPRRSLDQNSKLWPMLADVSGQVEWFVDGAQRKLTTWEWKDVFTAALKKHHIAQGIDGGFVVIGARTSRMSKGEFSELIELIQAFGSERGVVWSEPAKQAYAENSARRPSRAPAGSERQSSPQEHGPAAGGSR